MGIIQSVINYNNIAKSQQSDLIKTTYAKDAVCFGAKPHSLTQLNDGVLLSDCEKIALIVSLAEKAKYEEPKLQGPNPQSGLKGFLQGFATELRELFVGQSDDFKELEYQYRQKGKRDFVNQNLDFFKKIAQSDEASRLKGHKEFCDAISEISPKKYNLRPKSEQELAFSIAGDRNGALTFVKEHLSFFKVLMIRGIKLKEPIAFSVTPSAKPMTKTSDVEIPKRPNTTPEVPTSATHPEVPKEPPAKPPVLKVPDFDAEKTLAEYRAKVKEQIKLTKSMTPEDKALYNKQDEELRALRKELIDNNVSMIEKETFSLDPKVDVEAKKAYLISSKVNNCRANRASKEDYLELFEKYGGRYWYRQEAGDSSISGLTRVMGGDLDINSDKILRKYIDIMDKIAERDIEGMRDAVDVNFVFKKNAPNMSKETVLEFIKVLKRISFQQSDEVDVRYALEKTKLKEDKEILKALDDLRESLKDFPYRDRTRND